MRLDNPAALHPMTMFRLARFSSAHGLTSLLLGLGAAGVVLAAGTAAPTWTADDERSWAFTPERDTFSAEALFDLRALNDPVAGRHGFLEITPSGDFAFADGTPVRFWALNFEPRIQLSDEDLAYAARFLAKRGVNMVRWHGYINPKVPGSNFFHEPTVGPDDPLPGDLPPLEQIDEAERDLCWRIVAAMRREGIYTTLSPYWAVKFKHAHRWGLPAGVGADRDAQGLLFFEPRMQAAYRQWMKDLLRTPNPYTGIPLADDPAVGVIQFQNEDSLLFFTVDLMHADAKQLLARRFAEWLIQRHGSLDTARKGWGEAGTVEGDDWEAGVPALLRLDHYRQEPAPEVSARLAAQLEFYTRTMHDANADIARYLREELGVRCVLNASNWRTANGRFLNDAERWAYLPAEAIALNRYYTTPHLGPDRGFTVQVGHRFASGSALRRPQAIPLAVRQIEGRPMLVPESTWVGPNLYRAEAPLTTAAYQSLTGVDAYYWFSFHYVDWTQPTLVGGYYRGAFKWTSQTPDLLGLFPATALLYRRGDVQRAEPVLRESRSLTQVWHAKPPALVEEPPFDPNRDPAEPSPGAGTGQISPLAYLVGPVVVDYTDEATDRVTTSDDLSRFIDAKAGQVRSRTEEITLDYRRGFLRVDTPRAQGAAGFFDEVDSRCETSDATFELKNAYGQLVAVSLDDAALKDSRRVLLQIGTTMRPTGWVTGPDTAPETGRGGGRTDERVEQLGGPPWRIEQAQGRFTLRNPHVTQATVTDVNGLPLRQLDLQRSGDHVTIPLPPDALYVVLN